MRTKHFILIVLLTVLETSAQAQIVSSRSDQVIVTHQIRVKEPKMPRTFKWNLRLGYSVDFMTAGHNLSGISGFDASFGVSKPFKNDKIFWGVEAGAMTYGACLKGYNPQRCNSICVNPRIGVKFPIAQKTSFNLYGGPYISYRFGESGGKFMEIGEGLGGGINIGAELFVSKNFFFDLHTKKDLICSGECWYEYDIFSLKIVLGIGVQF